MRKVRSQKAKVGDRFVRSKREQVLGVSFNPKPEAREKRPGGGETVPDEYGGVLPAWAAAATIGEPRVLVR